MRRIYTLLGIASAQDVLDLQAANASLQRTARDLERAMESIVDPGRIADDVRDAIDIDDLSQQVMDNVDLDDVTSEARENFDVSDCIDVYELAQEVKDNIDLDDVAQEVKDNIDVAGLVADAMAESEQLDKLVNRAIEREVPGIIGAHLKHIDWDDELSIDVTVRSNR
jgi:hypothetical protein